MVLLLAAGLGLAAPVTYATVDGQAVQLEAWHPEGEGTHPGVLLIHGGGWRMGGIEDYDQTAAGLAAQGLVAVSTAYRLSQDAPWPAQQEDVGCALRWMRAHAADLHLDPTRIAAVGYSAGGHLALSLSEHPQPSPPWCAWAAEDGTVQAAVSLAGTSDLWLTYQLTIPWARRKIRQLVGHSALAPDRAVRAEILEASPLTWVDEAGPPVLQVLGALDTLVPPAVGRSFDDALARAGRAHFLEIKPGADHGGVDQVDNWLPFVRAVFGL